MMPKLHHDGIPAGNWDNKYTTSNPISRYLVRQFMGVVRNDIRRVAPEIRSVNKVGCGEGVITRMAFDMGVADSVRRCDFSPEVIAVRLIDIRQ